MPAPSPRTADDGVDLRSLAGDVEDLARRLRAEHGSEEHTLDAVVRSAVSIIPGGEHAAVSRVTRRGAVSEVETVATTDDVPRRVDQLQYEHREGPCWDAVWGQHVVRVDDLASDHRWPAFGPAAADSGIRSMVSFQLYVQGEELGALNVYAARPGRLDEDSEAVGLHVAAQASVALAAARKEEQLERTIRTRSTISTAVGMLAERYRLTPDVAFGLMVRISQERNIKVLTIAEVLLTTGVFPPSEEQAPRADTPRPE